MGGKTPSTAAANKLASLSQQMFNQSKPARGAMFKQLNEALRTGGIGARIPIIQRAVGDVRAGTAASSQRASEQFARSGLGGSPFAAQQLAQIQMAGSQQESRIPTDIAQQLISAGPGLISAGSGIPGLAAAANIQQSAANVGSQNAAAGYGAGGSAIGQILGSYLGNRGGGGGGTGAAGTPTAEY